MGFCPVGFCQGGVLSDGVLSGWALSDGVCQGGVLSDGVLSGWGFVLDFKINTFKSAYYYYGIYIPCPSIFFGLPA